ncbi:hypothetical protein QR680_004772 [Steinernema hermaphroditum]|uniref:Uncharacterized protein n=1 Tax=Steinernema hermaphroditum TaxID=289476 RepID=A0AA39HPR9_9BILA|nr:hypothetical protein QR680_004772 [Steinernema hermaphroditum]
MSFTVRIIRVESLDQPESFNAKLPFSTNARNVDYAADFHSSKDLARVEKVRSERTINLTCAFNNLKTPEKDSASGTFPCEATASTSRSFQVSPVETFHEECVLLKIVNDDQEIAFERPERTDCVSGTVRQKIMASVTRYFKVKEQVEEICLEKRAQQAHVIGSLPLTRLASASRSFQIAEESAEVELKGAPKKDSTTGTLPLKMAALASRSFKVGAARYDASLEKSVVKAGTFSTIPLKTSASAFASFRTEELYLGFLDWAANNAVETLRKPIGMRRKVVNERPTSTVHLGQATPSTSEKEKVCGPGVFHKNEQEESTSKDFYTKNSCCVEATFKAPAKAKSHRKMRRGSEKINLTIMRRCGVYCSQLTRELRKSREQEEEEKASNTASAQKPPSQQSPPQESGLSATPPKRSPRPFKMKRRLQEMWENERRSRMPPQEALPPKKAKTVTDEDCSPLEASAAEEGHSHPRDLIVPSTPSPPDSNPPSGPSSCRRSELHTTSRVPSPDSDVDVTGEW